MGKLFESSLFSYVQLVDGVLDPRRRQKNLTETLRVHTETVQISSAPCNLFKQSG